MKYPMRSTGNNNRTGLAVKLETRKHEARAATPAVKLAVGERPRLRQDLQESVAFLNGADAVELEDPLPQKSNVKKRQCLCCSADFTSEWAGERVCQKCKASNGWRSGVSSG